MNSPSSTTTTLHGDGNISSSLATPTTRTGTTADTTPRKAFFSPIADLWLSRSSIRSSAGASTHSLLPATPEDSQAESHSDDGKAERTTHEQDEENGATDVEAHSDDDEAAVEADANTGDAPLDDTEEAQVAKEGSWLTNGVNGLGKHIVNGGLLFGQQEKKKEKARIVMKEQASVPEPPPPPLPISP